MPDGAVRTKGIEPQPVPLNLKVVLIGNEELYEALLTNDDRFAKLFKIKAHMTETVERYRRRHPGRGSSVSPGSSTRRIFCRSAAPRWPGLWISVPAWPRTSASCRSSSRSCAT